MAHQLRAGDDEVALLALLDTFCPTLPEGPSKSFFDKMREHVKALPSTGGITAGATRATGSTSSRTGCAG